ncbi:MAG: response regulator transcription factor [Patescibacteria group bacterium]
MTNKKAKILIAEDEEILRRMYATKFRAEGFEVFETANGVETLEMAKKIKPEIILLDIIMPLADGFSVLKKIKEDKTLKDIPVILLTNLAQNNDIKEGLKIGAIDYLVKTEFTPSQVVEKVKKILKL